MEDKFWLAKIVNDSNDTIHNKARPKLTIEAQVTYMRDVKGIKFKMLIDLTQHATRCSDSSGQAQEYLIAHHAAVETETVLVQICLELGAPSVICSLKECFQITDK